MTLVHPARPGPPGYVAVNLGPWITPHVERFLDAPLRWRPPFAVPRDAAGIVGWGLKGVALRAKETAARLGLPYIALEDGFLRSVGLGDRDFALSLVVDDVGIYYDAHAPSRLEQLIVAPLTVERRVCSQALAHAWRSGRVSKYNHAPEAQLPVAGPFVLVVDQTAGDASIRFGMAEAASFERMLEAALDEHPRLPVILKVHPDVIAGRKRAHFGGLGAGRSSRVTLLARDVHPPALLEQAEAVYVVTSQMGFEALLWRRPVRCFGMPFYAGWGLTADELAAPARRRGAGPIEFEALVHAALIDYPRCLDPRNLRRGEVEPLLAWLAARRRLPDPGRPTPDAVLPRHNADERVRQWLREAKRWRDGWRRN